MSQSMKSDQKSQRNKIGKLEVNLNFELNKVITFIFIHFHDICDFVKEIVNLFN